MHSSSTPDPASPWPKVRAYLVHGYTASGVLFAFLAAMETCSAAPDPRWVFFWLLVAVVIDATDGPLARRWNVRTHAPHIGGHVIDDIVDYLTFTFVPLLLVWRMAWVPAPALVWIAPALVVSLFGFAHAEAKQAAGGFFLGFPSYWNIVAFYAGLLAAPLYAPYGRWVSAVCILALALLTVVPVRFVYPNRVPRPWRALVIGGGVLWGIMLLWMLLDYPQVAPWAMVLSLVYPVFYFCLSGYLDRTARGEGEREKGREGERARRRF